jgi:DedD protein
VDNRLKQRLIGAAVLVALAVIIVPELVKGPAAPDKPAVSNTVAPAPSGAPPEDSSSTTISLPTVPVPQGSQISKPTPEAGLANDTGPVHPVSGNSEPVAVSEERSDSAPSINEEPSVSGPAVETTPSAAAASRTRKAEVSPSERHRKTEKLTEAQPPVEDQRVIGAETTQGGVAPAAPTGRRTEISRKTEVTRSDEARKETARTPRARPAEVAKAEPAKPFELPKIELIGRSISSSPVSAASQAGNRQGSGDSIAMMTSAVASRPAAGEGWMVQVGSFSQLQNANSLREKLRSQRFNASVQSVAVAGRTLYRVRIGPQGSRAESEQVLTRLQNEAGVSGQVVPR